MSTTKHEMPLCFGRVGVGAGQADAPVGELRVRRPHLLAVERPSRRRPRVGRVVDRLARSLPASGSLNSWHHRSSASRIARQPARLLLVGAVGQQRRPDEVDADAADELGRAGAGQLLLHDVVLDRAGAAAAVLGSGHVTPTQRAVGQLAPATSAAEGDLVGQVVEPGRQAHAVLPRQVGRAASARHLGAERLLLGRRCQIHAIGH